MFKAYKDNFQEIIKIQNKNLQDNISNPKLVTDEQIIQFFDRSDFEYRHFLLNQINDQISNQFSLEIKISGMLKNQ